MIPFNKVNISANSLKNIKFALNKNKIGDRSFFYNQSVSYLKKTLNTKYIVLTKSCSASLLISGICLDLKKGDEVIVPSFGYVSSANSFALLGAKIVFADINTETLCLDLNKIKKFITKKTKAIVVINYANASVDFDKLKKILRKTKIKIIEDAAQSILSKYKKNYLGTLGDYGCISFHETKNITCGHGGALIFKKKKDYIKSLQILNNGTNKFWFENKKIKKYYWKTKGSSFILPEINAALLLSQLKLIYKITNNRIESWNKYHNFFEKYEKQGKLFRPKITEYNKNNGHIYYTILKSKFFRNEFIKKCIANGIQVTSHYLPLHNSFGGKIFGTTKYSVENSINIANRIVRFPLWFNIDSKLSKIFRILSTKVF